MRAESGDRAGASCPLCDAPIDSNAAMKCSEGCDEVLTTIRRESITYVYVHDSAGAPRRRVASGRPIAEG